MNGVGLHRHSVLDSNHPKFAKRFCPIQTSNFLHQKTSFAQRKLPFPTPVGENPISSKEAHIAKTRVNV